MAKTFQAHWLIVLVCCSSVEAKVTASLSQNSIRLGQSTQLNISSNNAGLSAPNLKALKANFIIAGSGKVSNPYIDNGQRKLRSRWFFVLRPKRGGLLTIPPIAVNGEYTTALKLRVTGAPSNAKKAPAKPKAKPKPTNAAELTLRVNKPKAYRYSQVIVTSTLFYPGKLPGSYQLSTPFSEGAIVKPLGKATISDGVKDSKPYQLLLRQYALFPSEAGQLRIQPSSFKANKDDGLPVSVSSKAVNLEVLAPASQTARGYWLPAEKLTLNESWQIPQQLKIGDTVERTITLTAQALTAEQLPLVNELAHEAVEIQLQDVELSEQVSKSGITAKRSETVSIKLLSAGTVQLAPIDLYWWDTANNRGAFATLPAKTLSVSPIAKPSSATSPQQQPQATAPASSDPLVKTLIAISLISTLGWLFSAFRRRKN